MFGSEVLLWGKNSRDSSYFILFLLFKNLIFWPDLCISFFVIDVVSAAPLCKLVFPLSIHGPVSSILGALFSQMKV